MAKKATESKNKKEWIIALVAAAVILVGAGVIICVNFMVNPSKIVISEDQESIVVKNGQEFTIELSSNATTGYSWSLNDTYNKSVVTSVGNEYIASN